MLKQLIASKLYQVLGAAVRNGLVAGGAWLTSQGLVTGEESNTLLTAGMIVFGVVWSFARKIWPELKV